MGNDPSAALIALGAVLLLILVLRWVFRPSRPRTGAALVDAAESPDLGLLTVVVTGVDRTEAMRLRTVLGEAGIRSSMSKRRDGALDVLVFHGDAQSARILLGP
ncbi:MAG: hypothetical protein QOC66_895 [Pseudonocardiales bacterium]|nr:hypothetical protein [Pseudonocardiales bacterium]